MDRHAQLVQFKEQDKISGEEDEQEPEAEWKDFVIVVEWTEGKATTWTLALFFKNHVTLRMPWASRVVGCYIKLLLKSKKIKLI